jgi:DNA mismatch endonuclease (patch repair protein)
VADKISEAHRSWNMSRIRSRDTKPEIRVRAALHRAGFRFRLHRRDLPGRPDIVLPKYKTAIFVHGCFWHRHAGCKNATTPSTNREFWQRKFLQNQRRDLSNVEKLRELGWDVRVIWECEMASPGITALIRSLRRKATHPRRSRT